MKKDTKIPNKILVYGIQGQIMKIMHHDKGQRRLHLSIARLVQMNKWMNTIHHVSNLKDRIFWSSPYHSEHLIKLTMPAWWSLTEIRKRQNIPKIIKGLSKKQLTVILNWGRDWKYFFQKSGRQGWLLPSFLFIIVLKVWYQ